MAYIQTDETGRLVAVSLEGFHLGPGEREVDALPEDFRLDEWREWMMEGGRLIRRALPEAETEPEMDGQEARLARCEAAAEKLDRLIGLLRESALFERILDRLEAVNNGENQP